MLVITNRSGWLLELLTELIKERASNPRPDNSIWGDRIVRYDYVDEVEDEDDDDEDEDGRDDEGDD